MGLWADMKAVAAEERAKVDAKAARTPEQKTAEKAEKKAGKAALRSWRVLHPAETRLNVAATARLWPSSTMGETKYGPVAGASAELFNADAHKGWTATRVVGGVATLGTSAALAGRKNKGHAAINLTFPNGDVQGLSYTVKPDASALRCANQYVTAFNALSAQLEKEEESTHEVAD